MEPRGPYIIDQKRYLHISGAAEIIGGTVSLVTLWQWAQKGQTPWGLELNVKRQPFLNPHRDQQGKAARENRILISEEDTLLLKDLLQIYRQNAHQPRRLTNKEIADLKSATNVVVPRPPEL